MPIPLQFEIIRWIEGGYDMTRRMIDREYAQEECDEVCQDILTKDRIEIRERTNRNNRGCERRRCETRCNNTNEVLNRRTNFATGTRISGEECPVEETNCSNWEDPCRCRWNTCGCQQWNTCGCQQCNRCGCRNNRCGYTRGLNCDRNRRLRSCNCNCGCNEY